MQTLIDDMNRRLSDVEQDIAALNARYQGRKFPDDARASWNQLNEERDSLKAEIAETQIRWNRVQQFAANPAAGERADTAPPRSPAVGGLAADPWNFHRSMAPAERADAILQRDGLPEHAKQRIADGLRAEQDPTSPLARWLAVTSDPAYRSAFGKLVLDPQLGHYELTDAERHAVARVRAEQRAMQVGTGSAGGFMVPVELDPAVMLSSDGSISPLRQISRVITIATSSIELVSSDGVVAEWLAESAVAADASPTVAQPTVATHKGSAWVPFSVEWQGDATGAVQELSRLLRDGADQLSSEAYATGTGTGQPEGVTGVAAGSQVPTTAADVLDSDDVIALQNALPPRFSARARWCGNRATINEIAVMETTAGARLFPEVTNDRLLGKPLHELSHLDAAGDTAAAGNDNVLVYGDFAAGFVIVDRVGTSIELVPHVFDPSTGRPQGERGLWMWFRTGSAVVVDNALRLLTA